jgi:hypothetical protein
VWGGKRLSVAVSIQCAQHPARGSTVLDLIPGQAATFGTCGCGRCLHDLLLHTSKAGHIAGRVSAFADHWRIDNLSIDNRLFIEDVEEYGQLVTVPPGRAQVVVPFEISRIMAGETTQVEVAKIFGPEPLTGCDPARRCPREQPNVARLDEESTYFEVLATLCNDRLNVDPSAALPTSVAIAKTMRERGRFITPRAIDEHINYLIDKLGLRPAGKGLARRSWRKEALATEAIRRRIITPDHTVQFKQ